jgi:hypothetical protein
MIIPRIILLLVEIMERLVDWMLPRLTTKSNICHAEAFIGSRWSYASSTLEGARKAAAASARLENP